MKDTNEKKRAAILNSPMRVISFSFAAVIAVGTLLLSLPIATNSGVATPLADSLFTATSATCVTGLVVYDTFTHWSLFGQLVILALIQIGGLGLVTFSSFFSIAIGKKLGLREMQLAQESISFGSMANINNMLSSIVLAVLGIEITGAALLSISFVPQYGLLDGLYISFFMAVSAFCNAGFDLLGREGEFSSLINYNDNPIVLITIMLLIILGGLGFVVWKDLALYYRSKKMSLQTRVVLFMSALLIALGALMFLLGEWNNPGTMGPLNWGEKIISAVFQSVTTRTAGFNSLDFTQMNPITKGFSSALMFIGAAPGSTGGGVKITTLAVIIMTIVAVLRGRDEIIIWGRRVDKLVVYRAITIMMLGLVLVLTSSLVLYELITQPQLGFVDVFFESVSAFATVGLSSGVTAASSTAGRLIMIVLMYFGRVGPVSFALSFAGSAKNRKEVTPEGKIVVG